jgi:hypothetical protein
MSDDDPEKEEEWITRRWEEYTRQMGRSEKDGKYYEVPIHPNCRENVKRHNKYYTRDQEDEWLKPQHVVGAVKGSRTLQEICSYFRMLPQVLPSGPADGSLRKMHKRQRQGG